MIAELPPSLFELARRAREDQGHAGPQGRKRRQRRRKRERFLAELRARVAAVLEVEDLYPAQRREWLRMNDRRRRRLVAEAVAAGLVQEGEPEARVREACFVLLAQAREGGRK